MTHRCPDEETFAAYFDGLLSPLETSHLHTEIGQCSDCQRLVGALGLVLAAEPVDAFESAPPVPSALTDRALELWPTNLMDRALRVAIRWIGDKLLPCAGALQPLEAAAVTVRGSASPGVGPQPADELRYQLTIGELPVEIDLETDGPTEIALHIRPLAPPPTGLLVRLTADGQTRAISTLGLSGTTLSSIPADQYQLTIEHRSQPLGHLHLALNA